jgi:GT2 family glycosyltransferase
MEKPLVYAVILAWNQKQDTFEALDSVLAMTYPNLRVTVADNGSTDGTADEVRARYPSVQVVRSERNLGITGGYNLGIAHALERGADCVLIMNNDIEVAPEMLTHLVSAAERFPDAGALMPKIYHYYGDRTRLWNAGARWRHFPPGVKLIGIDARDGPVWDQVREIAYAPSCVLLLSRRALEATGGFDVRYYFFQSDWDFSARLRESGFQGVDQYGQGGQAGSLLVHDGQRQRCFLPEARKAVCPDCVQRLVCHARDDQAQVGQDPTVWGRSGVWPGKALGVDGLGLRIWN